MKKLHKLLALLSVAHSDVATVRNRAAVTFAVFICLSFFLGILVSAPLPRAAAATSLGYSFVKLWPDDPKLPQISRPVAVGRDATGDVYSIDSALGQIIRFDSTGDVAARWGHWGDTAALNVYLPRAAAVNATGDVYVSNWPRPENGYGNVVRFGHGGADPELFLSDSFSELTLGISDDVWVTASVVDIDHYDSGGNLLSSWDTGGIVTQIAIDPDGYVYGLVGTTVKKYDAAGNTVFSWTKPTGFDVDELFGVRDMAFDESGYLYIADSNRIQKFTSGGTYVATVVESGTGAGEVYGVEAIDVGGGYLLTGEAYFPRIQRFTTGGVYVSAIKNPSDNGQFALPSAVAYHRSGYLYVADTGNYRIQKFDSDGNYVRKWGSYGSGDGQFRSPSGIAVDSAGNVYVADKDNGTIQKFTSRGVFVDSWDSENAYSVTTSSGYVYVGSSQGVITKYTDTGSAVDSVNYEWEVGERVTLFAMSNCEVSSLAVSPSDELYAVSGPCNQVLVYDLDLNRDRSNYWAYYNSAEEGKFDDPNGIDIDSRGYVYLADTGNHRVEKFEADGTFVATIGSSGTDDAQFHYPRGVAVSLLGSTLFVGDTGNNRVQKFTRGLGLGTNWLPEFMTQFGGSERDDGRPNLQLGDGRILLGGSTSEEADDWDLYEDDDENIYAYNYGSDGSLISRSIFSSVAGKAGGHDSANDMDLPTVFEAATHGELRSAYLVGQTGGTFDAGAVNHGMKDYFISKFTIDGLGRVFTKQFGSSGNDNAWSVAADDSGNVLVAGETEGVLPGQVSRGQTDSFVAKFDMAGALLWQLQTGDAGNDSAYAVDTLPDGSVLFGGKTTSSGGDSTSSAILTKLDPGGGGIWSRKWLGAQGAEVRALAVDGNGDVYVAGVVTGSSALGPEYGSQDMWLAKLDGAGDQLWSRRWGGTGDEGLSDLALDSAGRIYVVGIAPDDPEDPAARGGKDVALKVFDGQGVALSQQRYGGPGDDIALGVAVDPSGERVAISGSVTAALQNRPDVNGASDAFLVRFVAGEDLPRPRLAAFSPASGRVELRWSKSESDQDTSAFRVYDAATDKVLASTSKTSYSFKGLSPTAVRGYYVRPFTKSGRPGPASNAVRIRTSNLSQTDVSGGDRPVTVNPRAGFALTFEKVTAPGSTTATPITLQGQLPFKLIGDALEVSTSAAFTGEVDIAVEYDPDLISGRESGLGVYHFDDGSWTDVTEYVDTENNIVYGKVSSFSPIALGDRALADTGHSSTWLALGLLLLVLGGAWVARAAGMRRRALCV